MRACSVAPFIAVLIASSCHRDERDPAAVAAVASRPVNAATPTAAPAQVPAGSARNALRDSLPPEMLQRIASSPVAVLLPSDPAIASVANVTVGEHWYAAQIQQSGHSLYIHATDVVHDQVEGPPAAVPRVRVRGRDALSQLNEGIQSVAWDESGVYYVLEIECEDPAGDARCTNDAYARAMVESLVPVRAPR